MAVSRSLLGLAGTLAVSYAPALVGMRYQPDRWYRQLKKPTWNPPRSVFPIVWNILYFLMGLASWRVARREGVRNAKGPLSLFLSQLAINGAWSWQFFGRPQLRGSVLNTLGLLSTVAATTVSFFKKDRLAGVLMMPYLAWLLYTTTINVAVGRMNR